MNDPFIVKLLRRVIAANLEPATERVAIRLLLVPQAPNSWISLTWAEYMALCQITNRGHGRRQLMNLQQAGLAEYQTSEKHDRVLVRFTPDQDGDAP